MRSLHKAHLIPTLKYGPLYVLFGSILKPVTRSIQFFNIVKLQVACRHESHGGAYRDVCITQGHTIAELPLVSRSELFAT